MESAGAALVSNEPATLGRDFYDRDDVVAIGKELLGKVLATRIDSVMTRAIITETEAYAGVTDRASHAYGGRRTPRTEPMFGPGGVAYIYLCYGIHHLFNVVTAGKGTPHAVLVRAGQPLEGVDDMSMRRRLNPGSPRLMAGPGTFAQALGITTDLTGTDLCGELIWIEDHGFRAADMHSGPRIGIDYAGDDANRPYRFIATSLA